MLHLMRLRFRAMPVLLSLFVTPANGEVVARINLSSQSMSVSENGVPRYSWPVSTH